MVVVLILIFNVDLNVDFLDILVFFFNFLLLKPLNGEVSFLPFVGEHKLVLQLFFEGQYDLILYFVPLDLTVDLFAEFVHL